MNDRSLSSSRVTGGVDTHKDTHTAAVLDATGRALGSATFPASAAGYAQLLEWLRSFGELDRVGIEGTGSYGSGLTQYLREARVNLVEVNRPNRQARRRHGKSDPADAEAAARATLARDAVGVPKSQDGAVEVIRILRLERRSAIRARTQAANQLHAVVSTAPEQLRGELRALALSALITRACKLRRVQPTDAVSATQTVLRGLAKRWQQLDREVEALDKQLQGLAKKTAPDLLALKGIGVDVACTLLVAAGDNPQRLAHEASFAALCGVSPIDASSGRKHRHRLNRGGNRDANRALWVIALVRLRCDPRTRAYVARRTAEGLSKPEILRCLKRYIAREVFKLLSAPKPANTCQPPMTKAA
ncbi:MAG: IS110 family transposase [Labilithrix sp.]|nr:IS110 family transposase [Labilithrix sp.]